MTAEVRPLRTPNWQRSHGTWLSGKAALDEVDHLAAELEAKWGCGRLRLLVSVELREKFDRQRYLLNQANWHGDLEAVRVQSARMVRAWTALDQAATIAGKTRLDPDLVWEVTLGNGSVAAIVPDAAHAGSVHADGRQVAVYTLDEIGRLLTNASDVTRAKQIWPGATVVGVPRTVGDPLDAIHDTAAGLDDDCPF